jgi:hypothetical protein
LTIDINKKTAANLGCRTISAAYRVVAGQAESKSTRKIAEKNLHIKLKTDEHEKTIGNSLPIWTYF